MPPQWQLPLYSFIDYLPNRIVSGKHIRLLFDRTVPVRRRIIKCLVVTVVEIPDVSMKVPRLRNQVAQERRQIFQMPRNQVRHLALPFQYTVYRQQPRTQ
jgi:hypothetical protein